jgi:HEAT repeat protein
MSIYPELDALGISKLIEAFHRPAPDGQDYAYFYYSEVAWKLRQQGEVGNTALWDEISRANPDQLRAILFALTAPASAHHQLVSLAGDRLSELRELIQNHLDNSDSMIVAEAIDGLTHLGAKDVVNQIMALGNHPCPFVRGSVLRYAAQVWPEQAYKMLIHSLSWTLSVPGRQGV